MSLWRSMTAGLRGLFRRVQVERDLDDEIQHYLALATEERVRAGLTPDEAARAARLELGSIAATKETVREGGWEAHVESLWRDLVYATRTLRKSPAFTLIVVLTLALGIGAATVMFSLVNGVLFSRLPFADADRIVVAANKSARSGDAIAPVDLLAWRCQIHALDEIGGYWKRSPSLTGGTEPVRLASAEVTVNWFSMFGVQLELGRGFAPGEDQAGTSRVVVLSDALWRTQFGGDRSVIGRTVLLDGAPYAVIGVAPPRFTFPEHPDIWTPAVFTPDMLTPTAHGYRVLWNAVGRLRHGATIEQAQSQLRVARARLKDQFPEAEGGLQYEWKPLRRYIVGNARPALLVLLGGVACLLLIACANVATLLLVRATSRSAEIGIRAALGAGRSRIVRQLLAESGLLALAGGLLGVASAEWGVHALVATDIGNLPLLDDVAVDMHVLVFAVVVTLGTVLLFGLAPALDAARTDIARVLRSSSRGTSARKRSARMRGGLVVGELALAVPLLVAAALLSRSFARLVDVNLGFRPEGVVSFDVALPFSWYDTTAKTVSQKSARIRNFEHALVGHLQALPGTQVAAVGFAAPFTEWAVNQTFGHIEGHAPEPPDRPNVAEHKYASPGYFAALGVPLVRGRVFSDDDRPDGHKVVIVNQAFVRAYLPNEEPIGKRITNLGEIVGVVGDTKNEELSAKPAPAIYEAFDQAPVPWMTFLVRSTADPGTIIAAARAEITALDPTVALSHATTLKAAVRSSAAGAELNAWLFSGFASMALLLAVIGIYGVVTYAVRERQREIGIRLALGARRGQVVTLVLRQGLLLAVLGVSAGLVTALVASRALRVLLFGITPLDLATYGSVCGMLIVATLTASWLPARRAARVDPLIIMRPD